jgi:hypothetical protein
MGIVHVLPGTRFTNGSLVAVVCFNNPMFACKFMSRSPIRALCVGRIFPRCLASLTMHVIDSALFVILRLPHLREIAQPGEKMIHHYKSPRARLKFIRY